MKITRVAIAGSDGVPSRYGGFETLADNLCRHISEKRHPMELSVYCSSQGRERRSLYFGAKLVYLPFSANGLSSLVYDAVALIHAARSRMDVVLLLGVSGAFLIPFIRLFSSVKLVTNVDGLESRRAKWNPFSRLLLRWLELVAVRYSHEVIADNQGISDYIVETYGREPTLLTYGGDHATECGNSFGGEQARANTRSLGLPEKFALSVCRIEPENNIELILAAFAAGCKVPVVIVGNWASSAFGRAIKLRYEGLPGIYLLESIYDQKLLYSLRSSASLYVHGHSAGGTNPSLVEMMHFGCPIVCFECSFNRYTTEGQALYFKQSDELRSLVNSLCDKEGAVMGGQLREVARRRYVWSSVGEGYCELLNSLVISSSGGSAGRGGSN